VEYQTLDAEPPDARPVTATDAALADLRRELEELRRQFLEHVRAHQTTGPDWFTGRGSGMFP
jgi:hypothetical protein